MRFTVPTIDITPYRTPGATAATSPECARVAAEIDRACREVGFLQLVGHGVSPEAIAGLADALDAFFDLDPRLKRGYARPGVNRGYTPPRSESLSNSLGVTPANMMNDFYEAYSVGTDTAAYDGVELPEESYPSNTWPEAVPQFRPAIEAYLREVTAASRVLLRACSEALGLQPDHFDGLVDRSIDTLKMNNYTLPEGDIEIAGELTGMGAHTDFGLITLLWADQVAGLQVLGSDGGWHDVMPADGALLVNLGDATARLTNDQWQSTLHRVNPPVIDGRVIRRRSAAFFFDGNHDAVVEPLPQTVGADGPRYEPITIADHLAAKIAGLKSGLSTGEKPAGADREAARLSGASA
ncbi:2-oxoglutarate and iron-dependent oxygenase domain-containing protein [Nocardioides sp. YIM 152588]|uniref:isopenicillin N synthase family dioxygenase n=1 Tax=Nocardioides sp. YIM 152588 TaxID=3158259 RepID=UPI0032E3775A